MSKVFVGQTKAIKLNTETDNSVITARDKALAQLRTAIVVLRNTENNCEQIANFKLLIQNLLDAPEEVLWSRFDTPANEFISVNKPIKGRDQFPIIEKSLLLIGVELDINYVDTPEEKSWFLSWSRGKKARLFWTKINGWNATLYLAQGDGFSCSGFDLDSFLEQVGIDRTWWSLEW
jgi:hypothetical protein